MYFVMNDIADDAKKPAILLSVCGPKTYKIIHNLPQLKKSSDLSYVEWFSSWETTISHRSQFGSSVFVSTPTGDTQVRLLPATCVHCWAPLSLRALSVWGVTWHYATWPPCLWHQRWAHAVPSARWARTHMQESCAIGTGDCRPIGRWGGQGVAWFLPHELVVHFLSPVN